ncbi:MAG: aminotransferase class V-fold PLP-dependent enzyme [Phycisphaerales bacterium JB043]
MSGGMMASCDGVRTEKRVVYFDNAATSWPKPREVGEAIARFLAEDAANPGRSGHRMASSSAEMIERARSMLAELVRAPAHRMVLTHGCTDALNIAIHGYLLAAHDSGSRFSRAHGEGAVPHVVSTMLEHKACARPLSDLADRGVIELDLVGCGEDGIVDPDEIFALVRDTTAIIAVTHASNMVGTIQPVGEIGARIRRECPEVVFLVDGAQTVGVIPVDVEALGADFLAFPAHKGLLGPTGVGGLYVGERVYPEGHDGCSMRTCVQGGTGGGAPTMEMPRTLPGRFEAGTPNTIGLSGMIAALEHAPGSRIDHERACVGRIIEWADSVDGVRVVGTRDVSRRMGVVSLFFEDGRDPKGVASELDERFGIACRAGDHCATNAHVAMGTSPMGTLRFSAGPYTTDEDVETLLEALREIVG